MTTGTSQLDALRIENADMRTLLTQAGRDTAQLLKQVGIDATKNEAARQLQRLLLEELHHRVKNTLATVLSITSQSLRHAKTLEQGRIAVENRLLALGRAHDLMLQANWANAELGNIIRAAIEPFETLHGPRFTIQNTTFQMDATTVLPLTMSLNELCTNAVKYGALSNAAGRVVIALVVDEQQQLFKLTWMETGGPIVTQPTRHSFGTRLLNRLAEQLHGNMQLRYEPVGIVYELQAPLAGMRPLASQSGPEMPDGAPATA